MGEIAGFYPPTAGRDKLNRNSACQDKYWKRFYRVARNLSGFKRSSQKKKKVCVFVYAGLCVCVGWKEELLPRRPEIRYHPPT